MTQQLWWPELIQTKYRICQLSLLVIFSSENLKWEVANPGFTLWILNFQKNLRNKLWENQFISYSQFKMVVSKTFSLWSWISTYFLAQEIIFEGIKTNPDPSKVYFCVIKKLMIEWEKFESEAAGKLMCSMTYDGSRVRKNNSSFYGH